MVNCLKRNSRFFDDTVTLRIKNEGFECTTRCSGMLLQFFLSDKQWQSVACRLPMSLVFFSVSISLTDYINTSLSPAVTGLKQAFPPCLLPSSRMPSYQQLF
ncbi:calcium-dependent secretion activator 1 [Trichinella spiralis]|uniref:calcium-dependent secretion activator 1 n=1 Tax=Trichinella spiralis TaxID=6334 RepID=UPI0001EFC729|nr:calcium-dependent secretion activator 1 [Trichinella spiralis]